MPPRGGRLGGASWLGGASRQGHRARRYWGLGLSMYSVILRLIHGPSCTAEYCILYIVYCLLFTVYCILYTIYCILYTVYCQNWKENGFYGFCRTHLFSDSPPYLFCFPPNFYQILPNFYQILPNFIKFHKILRKLKKTYQIDQIIPNYYPVLANFTK